MALLHKLEWKSWYDAFRTTKWLPRKYSHASSNCWQFHGQCYHGLTLCPHIIDKISINIRLPSLKATFKYSFNKAKQGIFLTRDIQ